MFAADPQLEARASAAPAFTADADQLSDAFAVDGDERVFFVDALLLVGLEEARGVVARNAESGLREVVGAEREEFGFLRDLARPQSGAGKFDHRADEIIDLRGAFLEDALGGR